MRRGLLAVARQDLLTSTADLGPVRLQAAQNAECVVWIDLQLGLTKPCHIGMTGGAFLVAALAHGSGRRLRRKCLGTRGSGHEHESNRQHRYPDHDPPLRASGPSPSGKTYLIFYLHCRALQPFQSCCATIVCRCVVRPQHRSADALAPQLHAGIHLGRRAVSLRACQ